MVRRMKRRALPASRKAPRSPRVAGRSPAGKRKLSANHCASTPAPHMYQPGSELTVPNHPMTPNTRKSKDCASLTLATRRHPRWSQYLSRLLQRQCVSLFGHNHSRNPLLHSVSRVALFLKIPCFHGLSCGLRQTARAFVHSAGCGCHDRPKPSEAVQCGLRCSDKYVRFTAAASAFEVVGAKNPCAPERCVHGLRTEARSAL
jgi:hypothetical protein